MLKEKYNVIVSKNDNIEVKSFKEKSLAILSFNSILESLHKPGIDDWNGAALVESYGYKSGSPHLGGIPSEPSANEYGKEMDAYKNKVKKQTEGKKFIVQSYNAGYWSDEKGFDTQAEAESYKDNNKGMLPLRIKENSESIKEGYNIIKTDGYTNSYWDMVISESKDKPVINKLYEEVEFDLDNIDPVLEQESYDNGIANLIINEVNSEWNTISNYNNLIEVAKYQDRLDIVQVVQDIIEEEHKHIGQLQQLLKTIKPETAQILQGELEANRQIADIITEEAIEEPTDTLAPDEVFKARSKDYKYDISKGAPNMDSFDIIDYAGSTVKVLDYVFGNKLVTWSSFEEDGKTYQSVKLRDGTEMDVYFESTPSGLKVYNKETNEEILPIDVLEYPDEAIKDSDFTANYSIKSLASSSDDLDYINNF